MATKRVGLPTDDRWVNYKYDFGWVVQACCRCTNCKHLHAWRIKNHRFSTVCPSLDYYKFDAYASQGRMDIGLAVASGRLELTEKVAESLYKCTLCGACDANCKTNMEMEPLRVFRDFRELCVERGLGLQQHKTFVKSIEDNHNPFLESHEKRFAWMPRGVNPTPKADVAYFVGCTTAYWRPEIARATTKVLDSAGVKFSVLNPNEFCCGKPAHKQGYREVAKKMIEHNIKTANQMGVKTIVTSCPGCYMSLSIDADEISDVEREFEVMHFSQYASQLMDEGKLKFNKPLDLKVTYHDPCELARLAKPWKPGDNAIGNVENYETPRKILKSIPGLELVEMDRNKECSYCCGSDVGWAFSDFVSWTSNERLQEALSTGAQAIVSWCPTCATNFKHVAKGRIKVFDASECIMKAL